METPCSPPSPHSPILIYGAILHKFEMEHFHMFPLIFENRIYKWGPPAVLPHPPPQIQIYECGHLAPPPSPVKESNFHL